MNGVVRRVFGLLGSRKRVVGGTVATSLLTTAIVVAAVQSDGSTATNVRLDDGAVWVTNSEMRRVGRLNMAIKELDFSVAAAEDPGVLQDGRTVLFSGRQGGVQRVDVTTGAFTTPNEIPFAEYWIGGGVGAVIDPETGALWVGADSAPVAPEFPGKPDALVESGSRLIVTPASAFVDADGDPVERGKVIVVGPEGWYEVHLGTDKKPLREGHGEVLDEVDDTVPPTAPTTTTTVAPTPDDVAGEPEPEPLYESQVHPLGVNTASIHQVTAVGATPVVLTDTGEVAWTAGDGTARVVTVPGTGWQVQQPGPAAAGVLVASDSGLYEVELADAATDAIQLAAAAGLAAQPVRVGACVFAAWSSAEPLRYRECSNGQVNGPEPIPGASAGAELVFRVNQNNVVLNNTGNGDLWADHDGTLSYVGNWDDVEPQQDEEERDQSTTGESEVEVERDCQRGGDAVPVAGPDDVGVRPRQTVIDLLHNDDDLNCQPLAIAQLVPSQGEWGALTVVDNGQHVLYSPSDAYLTGARDRQLSFTFQYTVQDTQLNESAPADVTVRVRDLPGNNPPALRPKGDDTRQMRTVVEEGKEIAYNVMPDWWDPDGDDLRLVGAVALTDGRTASTPEGVVTYRAFGVGPGVYDVEVTVTDGYADWTETLEVTVKPTGSAIPPTTADDFLTLSVGQTATISPLDNDSDGNKDELTLIPAWPAAPEGYQARKLSGEVVEITGHEPGVYQLDYLASDGTSSEQAAIRVEVRGTQEHNTAPVAVPDKVTLRPNRVVNVEVLGNDVDLDGDLLGVIDVDVPLGDPDAGEVRATIVDRRMLQLEVVPGPTGTTPTGPFDVFYRVTDGREGERAATGASADQQAADRDRSRGTVTILIQPPGVDQPPVAGDDTAKVRTGSVVAVPVLRNDVDPDSDEIELVGVTEQSAAAFTEAGGGIAWATGRDVYVWGAGPRFEPYVLAYEIVANGVRATGQLTITVTAEPDDDQNQNQLPEPPQLVLRAVRNAAVRLQVPTTGIDPDGDSVGLTEVGVPGEAARGNSVVADGNVIEFTAGHAAPASDTFTYKVADPYGGVAEGTVRVLVLDQQDWGPQAHDDVWKARPGRTLNIPVLANDVSPQDLPIRLAELPFFDLEGQPTATPINTDHVRVLDQSDPNTRGFVEVTVPTIAGALVEQYRIVDEGGRNGKASIVVTPDPDAPNMPPVAVLDDHTTPQDLSDRTEVVIDVLANDYDPDGERAGLRLSVPELQPDGVRAENGLLVVPVTEHAQTILYRVTDTDGASTIGFAIVPGDENHPPVLSDVGANPNARVIEAATPEPMLIDLAVVVSDPDGDTDIRLTDTEIELAPGAPGEVRRASETTFTYLPPPELTVTTTVLVTFEVTDRPDLSSQDRLTTPRCNCLATLSTGIVIEAQSPPVIVGPGAISVPQLDEVEYLDVAPLSLDPEGDPLTYVFDEASFGGLEVDVDGSRLTLVSRRGGDELFPVGHQIQIRYTVADETFDPVPNVVNVTISGTNAPPPVAGSVGPFDDVERDALYALPASANLVAAASNPFPDRPLTLIEWNVVGPGSPQLECSENGSCTFLTDTVGTFAATYTLQDSAQRTVQGTFALGVKGKPREPGVPGVDSVGDHVVNLSWTAADMQLGEFERYVVTAIGEDGSTLTRDSQTTSLAFDGLTNDVGYRFTVVAWNEMGEGEPSGASSVGRPDRVPDPPVGLAFTDYQDGQLSIEWAPPPTANDFSAITDYEVDIGGRMIAVPGGSQTTLVVDELTNGQRYSFRVRARNSAGTNNGWGAWSATRTGSGTQDASGMPSRYPDVPGQPSAVNSGDGGTPRITVTWEAPGFDGGRSVTQYEVCRVESGECQTTPAATRQATFQVGRAQSSTFTVRAFNSDKNRDNSELSTVSAPVTAVGNPDPPTITSVTSGDKQLTVQHNAANNSGCGSSSTEFSRDSGTSWQSSPTFTGLTNGTSYSFVARTVLSSSCGTPGQTYQSSNSNSVAQTPYGNLRQPTISAERSGNSVRWHWATNRADDGRPGWSARLSGNCGTANLSSSQGATGTTSYIDFGYSATVSCTITISANGVNSLTASASATTPAPPASISLGTSTSGGMRWITGSGSNFPAGARYHIRCAEGGVDFANTETNLGATFAARYVSAAGTLSWGSTICWNNTVGATTVTVWVPGGPSVSATI